MVKFGKTEIAKGKFYAAKKPFNFGMLMLIIELSQNS